MFSLHCYRSWCLADALLRAGAAWVWSSSHHDAAAAMGGSAQVRPCSWPVCLRKQQAAAAHLSAQARLAKPAAHLVMPNRMLQAVCCCQVVRHNLGLGVYQYCVPATEWLALFCVCRRGGLAFLIKTRSNKWLGNAATYKDFFFPTSTLPEMPLVSAPSRAAVTNGITGPKQTLDAEK